MVVSDVFTIHHICISKSILPLTLLVVMMLEQYGLIWFDSIPRIQRTVLLSLPLLKKLRYNKSAIDLSTTNPARGHKKVRTSTGHTMVTTRLLSPTGIPIATKSLPGPTNRERLKLIGVMSTSLGTNYSFYCLECCQYFRTYITSNREDCLVCCPSNKVIKSDTKRFLALGGLHEDKLCDIYKQWHRPMSK